MKPWYKEIGYAANPFSIKPLAYNEEIYGYDTDSIFTKIDDGQVVLIHGQYGKGKTAILKKIIRRFGGSRKLIYYSCNRTEDTIDFDRLIEGRFGLFGKALGIKSSDLIILLDEAQDMKPADTQVLKEYYKKYFKSIVLVTHDAKLVTEMNGITDLLGENVIALTPLTSDDAIKIVRKRIGNIQLLSDDMIRKIFEKSDANPRHLLKNCEDVCRHAINNGYSEVKEEHLSVIGKK